MRAAKALMRMRRNKSVQPQRTRRAQSFLKGTEFSKESPVNFGIVIPAKAGIQKFKTLDSGMRRNDGSLRFSLVSLVSLVVNMFLRL